MAIEQQKVEVAKPERYEAATFGGPFSLMRHLSDDSEHGWDVSAELDRTVVRERHCSDWRAVERMEIWLLGKLCESSVLT